VLPARRNGASPRIAGAGSRTRVETWSGEHLAALAVAAAAAALLVAIGRRGGDRAAGRALAVVIAAAYVVEQLTYALRGEWSAQLNLPLHLTDAVTFASVAALWRPQTRWLVELVYFWALSASLQAVLTPDLGHGFPDVLFFTYFTTHAGAVAAALMLVAGARRVPRPGAVGRVYAVTAGFAVLAGVGTVITGGNYMYLRHKPARDSLLDLMGPWPVYIAAAAALGLAIFAVLDLIARPARARTRRR
jgi:hypothetical integral membrane protein (TIGR02206 family)